jgi:hypothetical protein
LTCTITSCYSMGVKADNLSVILQKPVNEKATILVSCLITLVRVKKVNKPD